MKHMSRSSDPYVELVLLTFHPTTVVDGRTNEWKDNINEVLSHFTDIDYNILNGHCVIRADLEFDAMEEMYGCSPTVVGYQRTNVQVISLLPLDRCCLLSIISAVFSVFASSLVFPSLF
jgi:hypothetical protein